MAGVNTLYAALASNPGLRAVDFSAVRLCVAGGMATHSSVAERWRKATGRVIVEGYGPATAERCRSATPESFAYEARR